MNIANDMTELVGKTPMVFLNRMTKGCHAKIAAKLEFFNPASSVKDRIGLSMIVDAEKSGKLKPGMTIVEPTSGNTGISLAMAAKVEGYRLVVVMPENTSPERTELLRLWGAEIIYSSPVGGSNEAVRHAKELAEQRPD